MVSTRNLGTPFSDSLTHKQKQIKKEQSTKRRNIFIQGLFVGGILIYIMNYMHNKKNQN